MCRRCAKEKIESIDVCVLWKAAAEAAVLAARRCVADGSWGGEWKAGEEQDRKRRAKGQNKDKTNQVPGLAWSGSFLAATAKKIPFLNNGTKAG